MILSFHENPPRINLRIFPLLFPLSVLQTVKDIVQSLVDDGLVDTDKVGSSVFFWAFPSKATLQVVKIDSAS